jgi:hypothetical protein
VTSAILQAAIVYASVIDLNGGKATFADSLRVGAVNFFPILAISILISLGVMLGMILLIVPGVMMAIAWMVAVPVRVIEKKGILASIGRSAELTRGSRWHILGLFCVYLLIGIAFGIVAGIIIAIVSAITGGADSTAVRVIISPVINGLTSMVVASGIAATYQELRSRREGVGPEELAAVFD